MNMNKYEIVYHKSLTSRSCYYSGPPNKSLCTYIFKDYFKKNQYKLRFGYIQLHCSLSLYYPKKVLSKIYGTDNLKDIYN